jgi:hypothetical protein
MQNTPNKILAYMGGGTQTRLQNVNVPSRLECTCAVKDWWIAQPKKQWKQGLRTFLLQLHMYAEHPSQKGGEHRAKGRRASIKKNGLIHLHWRLKTKGGCCVLRTSSVVLISSAHLFFQPILQWPSLASHRCLRDSS